MLSPHRDGREVAGTPTTGVCVWGRRRRAIATCGPGAPPAGPRQVQTGLPTPFPAAGGCLRVAPQNTHAQTQTDRQTETPPPPPPHLKAQGSFPPGTVPPRRPALRCRGRSRCLPFPPFSFLFLWRGENPARGLRGAEGAPATCRRGGEGGRPGRPARGGGGEEGSRAEPAAAALRQRFVRRREKAGGLCRVGLSPPTAQSAVWAGAGLTG